MDVDNNTLDLTNVRFSVQQILVILMLVLGLAGTWAVTMWRVNDIATQVTRNTQILTQVQLDNARQDAELNVVHGRK